MDEDIKHAKKRRPKKEGHSGELKGLEALAKFTNSDIIRQVKAGLSRIAPLEPEPEPERGEDPFPFEEPPL